ncbi:MAG: hypothetical protein LLG04_05040, partial [Parachlamydia sp.]|nr:hypothetical protein [Parachlamydia sp.]
YLLELAAAGEGVDQRSFADRARRTLKRIYKDPNDDSYKFYDMVARYSRGVGYFHDGSFRKAVLDFNYIIHELKEHLEKEFYKKRKAYQLLYLPSILYRAEIQNELQLAYHASDTVSDEKLKSLGASEHSPHKENKIHLIRAEALQQMGLWDDAWKELSIVARSFGTRLGSYETAIPISALPGEQYSNIKSKLQSLVEAEHQWYLKNSKLNQTTFIQYLTNFKDFLNKYAESARHQEPNRIGYLKEVANFLNWLAKRYQDSNKTSRKKIGQVLRDLFDSNKANLVLKEEEDEFPDCPCDNSTISLWGLKSEEYQVFYENMLELLDNVSGLTDIDSDRKEFILNLTIHERNNDKLHWRIRKFNLSREDVEFHDEWIDNRCLSERQPPKDSVFDGLLECVSTPSRYCQTRQSLGRDFLVGQDYETIMNAWDEHFINHLKVTTIHAPYKRSLHFLGLQRWNSTSPAQGRSLGGGYLIYHTDNTGKIDLGVAIDPGFDFVRNLFHAGFSLADIDVVVMSHAHVDHVRDFESMISLLLELKKRKRLQLKVHAVMT